MLGCQPGSLFIISVNLCTSMDINIHGYYDSRKIVNIELIDWSVRSSIKRDCDWVKWVEGGNRYFSPLRVSRN